MGENIQADMVNFSNIKPGSEIMTHSNIKYLFGIFFLKDTERYIFLIKFFLGVDQSNSVTFGPYPKYSLK